MQISSAWLEMKCELRRLSVGTVFYQQFIYFSSPTQAMVQLRLLMVGLLKETIF